MKRVSTVNIRHSLEVPKYSDKFNYLTSVMRNIRTSAINAGYDLGDWNDAEVLSLRDVIDEEEDFIYLMERL